MITVTMEDTFMSGWGPSEKKRNIVMVHCNDLDEAEVIERNALLRGEMTNIKIRDTNVKPYYSEEAYLVSEKTFNQLGGSWKQEEVE